MNIKPVGASRDRLIRCFKYYITNNTLIARHHILWKSACSETVAEKVWCYIHLLDDYTLRGAERPCKYRAVQGSRSWPLPVQRGARTRNQSVPWAALVYPHQRRNRKRHFSVLCLATSGDKHKLLYCLNNK